MRGTAEAPPHYGRAHAWHWQAAQKNFLAAWSTINAPVLVIHGEYDQFKPRMHSHEMIVDLVNDLRPGSATFIQIPKADHSLRIYPSARAAYRDKGGETNRALFVTPVIAWLKKIVVQ